MITGTIKNKIDKIWTDIWAGGITNPITVIEQMTYLMFIRSLDEKELETEEFENMMGEKSLSKIFPQSASGQAMRWSKFKDRDPRDIYDLISQRVFPAIKNMKNGHLPDFSETGEMIEIDEAETGNDDKTAFSRYMSDAMFLIPTPQVLQKIITGLEDLYEHDIPDIIARYHNLEGETARTRKEQSFFVPKEEIVGNAYDLSINKYKETEYVPVEYPPTQEILEEIERINKQVEDETSKLKALLGLID